MGSAAGFSVHVFGTFTFIYGKAIAVRNDGKDLEVYSRDFSIVSQPPHEAILKHTFLPFTIPYQFIRFSSLLLGLTKSNKRKKIITSFMSLLPPVSLQPYTSPSSTLPYIPFLLSSHSIRTVASKNNDVLIVASYMRFGLMYGGWKGMEGNTRVAIR